MCRGTRDTRFELLPTRRRVMVPDCVQLRKSGTVSCPVWSFVIQRTLHIVEWWTANPNRFQPTTMTMAKLIEKRAVFLHSKCKAVEMAPSHHRRPAKTPSKPWYPARAAVLSFWQTRRCNASEHILPQSIWPSRIAF
ncbi:hypothetical protein QBC45DRAFT_480534 [Copromyces sp. CBS 386.78]|nr:hypothetical protein QBC45DRAFT_480534 [Copromyces sp. CBS 386.78]